MKRTIFNIFCSCSNLLRAIRPSVSSIGFCSFLLIMNIAEMVKIICIGRKLVWDNKLWITELQQLNLKSRNNGSCFFKQICLTLNLVWYFWKILLFVNCFSIIIVWNIHHCYTHGIVLRNCYESCDSGITSKVSTAELFHGIGSMFWKFWPWICSA